MRGEGSEAPVVSSLEREWDSLRTLIRDLEEERDLEGLASIAEMSLMGLRALCERPSTCEALNRMLEQLRGLKLDPWELGEEE